MYFPQGHEAYLRTFPENKTPPYKLFKGRPAVVRCQVRACVRACCRGFVLDDGRAVFLEVGVRVGVVETFLAGGSSKKGVGFITPRCRCFVMYHAG